MLAFQAPLLNMFQQRDLKMKPNLFEDPNITNKTEQDPLHTLIPYSIRFTLLLIFEIPSILCYIFVITYILIKKSLRSASNNYTILIMLFISFGMVILDIPWEMDYYRRHTILVESRTFCSIWWFIDIDFSYTCQMLVTWTAFERHIIIFHAHLFNQKWKKICFHYMPPLILTSYMMIFYIYALFLISCENPITFENGMCTFPCYLNDPVLSLWESIFHNLFTTICIFVFSCTLLIRVYRSRTRLQRSVNWRKYRKMIFQLISISSLYLVNNIPDFIITIFYMTRFSEWEKTALECLNFFGYFIPLLLPFIWLTSLPKIRRKLKRIVSHRLNQQIAPIPLRALTRNYHIATIET